MTQPRHYVSPIIEPGGHIRLDFTCAAPEGATCRLVCSDPDCELDSIMPASHVHDMIDEGQCWVVPSYNSDTDIFRQYAGSEEVDLVSGPVDLDEDPYSPSWNYVTDIQAPAEEVAR